MGYSYSPEVLQLIFGTSSGNPSLSCNSSGIDHNFRSHRSTHLINGVDSEYATPHDFENPTVGDVYTIGNPAYTWSHQAIQFLKNLLLQP